MLQLPRREPLTDYVLRDSCGHAIGRVIAAAGGVAGGPGAETVLLVRYPAAPQRPVVATAA